MKAHFWLKIPPKRRLKIFKKFGWINEPLSDVSFEYLAWHQIVAGRGKVRQSSDCLLPEFAIPDSQKWQKWRKDGISRRETKSGWEQSIQENKKSKILTKIVSVNFLELWGQQQQTDNETWRASFRHTTV